MQAKEFIEAKGWTLRDTLERVQKIDPDVGISVAQLSRLINGLQWPSKKFVVAFNTLSRGKVDANTWAGIE